MGERKKNEEYKKQAFMEHLIGNRDSPGSFPALKETNHLVFPGLIGFLKETTFRDKIRDVPGKLG